MNRRTRHAHESRHTPERVKAAGLLRKARHASDHDDELTGWVHMTMPDHFHAQRIRIEQLLTVGDHAAADALIAQGLLQYPTDPTLAFLHARSLFAQRDVERAEQELRLVLHQRPKHVGALCLAAHVASQRDNHTRAARLLEHAGERRPLDDAIIERRIVALIECGRANDAESLLQRVHRASPLVESRVYRRQGRLADAAHCLDTALKQAQTDEQRDSLMAELIETLDLIGDSRRMIKALERTPRQWPAARLRSAIARLGLGAFTSACTEAAGLRNHPVHGADALAVLVVAAACAGRPRLAGKAMCRAPRTGRSDRSIMISLWRAGFLGKIVRDQESAQTAGRDPSPGILDRMLVDSIRVLVRRLAQETQSGSTDTTTLQRHIETCQAALGRHGTGIVGATDRAIRKAA